jgi:hypothetical protein
VVEREVRTRAVGGAEKDEVVALPVVATIGARAFVDFVTTVFAQRASSGKP